MCTIGPVTPNQIPVTCERLPEGVTAGDLISRFRPDCWMPPHGGDKKTNNLLPECCGIYPIHLDEASDEGLEALSVKIIKV